jgi:hypothetical protein
LMGVPLIIQFEGVVVALERKQPNSWPVADVSYLALVGQVSSFFTDCTPLTFEVMS